MFGAVLLLSSSSSSHLVVVFNRLLPLSEPYKQSHYYFHVAANQKEIVISCFTSGITHTFNNYTSLLLPPSRQLKNKIFSGSFLAYMLEKNYCTTLNCNYR
jgi:hypothetical protein